MEFISYTSLRQNLKHVMDVITDDREIYQINRVGKEPLIMMTKDDYEAMDETAFLLSRPENVKRLDDSIAEMANGGGKPYEDILNELNL